MHSHRFDRPIILTRHARLRMDERNISEAELLSVIDTGETRYKDAVHLWAFQAHRPPGDSWPRVVPSCESPNQRRA